MWKKAQETLLKDLYIGPLIKKYGDCTIVKRPKSKYFESLVSSIIGQQLSGKAADAIFEKTRVGLDRVEPQIILKTSELKLRSFGLSPQKIKYLKDLSRKVERGEVEIFSLEKLSDELVIEKLVAVKGIGLWTAQMFLIFTLARPDIFPQGDLGIKKGIYYMFNKSILDHKMGIIIESWKPYRSIASWYIWKSLENQ